MAKSCCRSTLRVTVGCCAAAEVAHEGAHPQKAATATAPIIPSIEFLNIFSSSCDGSARLRLRDDIIQKLKRFSQAWRGGGLSGLRARGAKAPRHECEN